MAINYTVQLDLATRKKTYLIFIRSSKQTANIYIVTKMHSTFACGKTSDAKFHTSIDRFGSVIVYNSLYVDFRSFELLMRFMLASFFWIIIS